MAKTADSPGHPPARAEIVATGEEIRSGALVDSNSAWLAEKLEEHGFRVDRLTAVGDDVQALAELILEIAGRSQLAVVTGGLGPTPDDLTAEAAAQASGQDLVLNERGLEQVESFFRARNRHMPALNRKQAMLPAGAELIENPIGTAPGFSLSLSGCRFSFLPGVPGEMKAMFTQGVAPDLIERFSGRRCIRLVRTLRTFGLTESGAAERLAGFPKAFPGVDLGFRASFPEIQVKLSLPAEGDKPGSSRLERASDWVKQALGPAVFSTDGSPLEKIVGDRLRSRSAGVGVAESCTGGLIGHLLTSIAGSSEYFLLSAVTYANQSKIELLGVSPRTLEEHGAVSEQTALEMARGIRKLSAGTYGLATTGIAGPGGGSPDKPVGTLCIGLVGPQREETRRLHYPFRERSQTKRIFAHAALDLLRRRMLDQSGNAG